LKVVVVEEKKNNNTYSDKPEAKKTQADNKEAKKKKTALKKIIVLALILGFILAFTQNIVRPLVIRPLLPSPADEQYFLRYMQVAEVVIISYFAIELVAGLAYNLVVDSSEQTAKSMKSLVRIAGSVIVIAFVISFLSQNPVIAASISTVSGLVIGFGASNIIGNALGGIYLAIVRPFRIGERIKVFNEIGIVYDIGLLYTHLILENGDQMLASNSSMVSSQIVLKKK
jgi:small-conductance mechanosensitive channel